MFPTLFPWGVGGFEGTRTTPLSFNRQATYLLDLAQNDFRRHWSYIFIVANIKQRRAVHLGTRLACKARDHEHFTTLLAGLDSTVVKRVSQRVARGEDLHGVTGVEGRIFSLLKKCELVSAMVPGSKAIMNRARADIRAYIGEFGIFQLFLTLNPSPTHSPVFQVFFGDETVDLEVPCPTLPSASARAKRVADDPVAAADYFHFHLAAVFHCLLGWDMRKKKPSAQGGILGELAAYFLVKEFTMRGQLHSHCLLWLKGGLNPSTLRAKLRNSDEFRARYLQFFDDLIAHELPPSPTTAAPSTSSEDSGDPEPEPAQQDADRPATQDAFAQGEVMLADNAMELDGAELEAEGGPIVEASNGAITHEERESEDAYLLPLNNKGMAHQVEDYLHRGDTLADLTFYDFVRCCKIIKKPRRWNKNHHPLGEDHANVAEHCHRYAPDAPLGIPRAIFSSFPRSNGTDRHGDSYCSSMLAHFIPFSEDRPLKQQHQTWEQVYADALFSTDAQRIMSNWAALTECEDARDDEQLCRRKREAARSFDMDADITLCRDGDEEAGADNPNADVDMELLTQQTRQSKETLSYMSALAKSGWFDSDNRTGPGSSNNEADSPVVSFDAKQRRRWTAEQDILEAQTKADLSIPKATQGILAEQLDFEEDHAMGATNSSVSEDFQEIAPPPTRRYLWTERAPNEMLDALATERNLTPSQALAFTMAGRRFLENLSGVEGKPLRLLMHGEAGTGKTVVVRLLRELMDRFGQGKTIMFMAPTGKAAAAIGGTTQHSAFGLDVQQRGLTTDELNAAPASDTGRRIRFLQDKFKNVKWLFFDEVSMTSCEVLAEIDHALRVGTQQLDEPFGGVNVLFAGDLCQLPPVLSSPLYSRASRTSLSAEQRTKVELGRAAWLQVDEVVEFHEQMRMQDAGMAAALSRLRIRACTHDDVNLFNSNVLRSTENPTGVEVKGRGGLVVLARTNATVRALNERKASVQASMDRKNLTTSHAIDKSSVSMDSALRRTLLSYNGQSQKRKIGAARLPLYIGMPIVYRGRNASICLGVTNGAFGSVAGWDVSTDKWGHKVATGAVIRFDEEAQWSLTGLQPGCLPVYPATTSFSFKDEDDVKHSISRR
ncbi:unnamed protein product, partial [Tilletia controversa]